MRFPSLKKAQHRARTWIFSTALGITGTLLIFILGFGSTFSAAAAPMPRIAQDVLASSTPTDTPTNTPTNTPTSTPTQFVRALTPGYWKNHQAQLTVLLPVSLGNYVVDTYQKATAVFDEMNCGSSKPSDAIGCLAGQLLAAKLNIKNGSSSCISQTISKADAFLSGQTVNGVTGINYDGPGKTYKLSSAQRKLAVSLKNALDTCNNSLGCPVVMNTSPQLASTSTQTR